MRAGDGDAALSRISSASITARGTTGTRPRAAMTSGLSPLTAVEVTTASGTGDMRGIVAGEHADAQRSQSARGGAVGRSEPDTV